MNEELMNRRLRRMSRIVIVVGLLLLTTGVLFVLFLLNTMKDAALDQMRVETKEYNKRLYDQIDADYQIINTFASIVGESDLSSDPEFPEMLNEANYQNDFLTMIYADQEGKATAANLNMGYTEGVNISDVQPEAREVLKQALLGESSMSQMFHGAISNEAVFVYGTPVYKGDEIIGAVAASDKVEIFSEILNGEGVLGGYGYINMINSDGDYIVHSEKDQIGKDLDNVFSEPYFEGDEAEKAKQEFQENGELSFSFRSGTNQYEAIIQPVGINDWYLLSIGDVHTSSRQVYMLVRIIGSVFAVILVLVLFLLIYNCRSMRQSSRELRKIAYHDALTGVYNLIGFRKQVEKQIYSDKNYSIIALNVHQFRFINEIFGKEQGDRIINKIGKVICSEMSDGDIVCRESADIFYVFTKETDEKVIEERFKKIMNRITFAARKGHGDYELLLYCGATVNIAGPGECSLDEVMTHVMTAVRRARDVHQNNIWFFDRELHRREMVRHYVETHMNQAMHDGDFKLYLQPKVSLESDQVDGAEALVRWIKADGEIIYPNQFIPLFESNGFCVQLDLYMVESVCRQMREWMDRGLRPVPVSVNQSKRVIYEKDYLKNLLAIVEKYRIPAELITLEILEGLAVENVDEINRKIDELQKKGFRVSLDDFGTEYSSFSTLSRLQVNELKLDRSFLKDLRETGNLKIKLIMEEIVEIAHKLNIKTVVEGVETKEDHKLIKEINCDCGQGYHYSRPVDAEEFTRMFLQE